MNISPGTNVKVTISRRLAMELAAYGTGDQEKALGWRLLREIERSNEAVIYNGVVRIPPGDPGQNPGCRVCVAIPELDDTGDLFAVSIENLQPEDL